MLTKRVIVVILCCLIINFLACIPYLSARNETVKNLTPLPISDAKTNIQKFTEKSPAEIVKTLYGIGETEANSIVKNTCSLKTLPRYATSLSIPYQAISGAPTYP